MASNKKPSSGAERAKVRAELQQTAVEPNRMDNDRLAAPRRKPKYVRFPVRFAR
ncbi:MAG: hypothetical protein AAB459_01075 [Patescibacteria group bacterium]|jgi:hypothetical protein